LQCSPLRGHVFLFCNAARNRINGKHAGPILGVRAYRPICREWRR
jgi:hypothetical protein